MALNSYATENPDFIEKAVNLFGSSTIMVNVDAKKKLIQKLGKFIKIMDVIKQT